MKCPYCGKDNYPSVEFKPVPKDVSRTGGLWCPSCDKKDMEERLDNEIRWMRQ